MPPTRVLAVLAISWAAMGVNVYPAERPENAAASDLPSLREVLAAQGDLWGDMALRQPNGPSYEFFAGICPPLCYVNAAFRHYPIVLSSPRAVCKARLISNGSSVNARANLGTWREVGFPVRFLVGARPAPFGEDLDRLEGPRYRDGYLPIVNLTYRSDGAVYRQECFAGVVPPWPSSGALFLRFSLEKGERGSVHAVVESPAPLTPAGGALRDAKGQVYVRHGSTWQWDAAQRTLRAAVAPGQPAILAVLTQPAGKCPAVSLDEAEYQRQLAACEGEWKALLGRAMRLEVPEQVVQDAWRALLVGTLMIASGDRMNYSAGNAYGQMYAEESSSPIHALLMYGLTDEARPMVGPILAFQRQPHLKYHNIAFKLQLLARYYWLTRDAAFLRATRAQWRPEVDDVVAACKTPNGLLPKENYCGDIATKICSLNSNVNCWRGLRDLGAVLDDMGQADRALEEHARQHRRAILDAVAKSEDRSTDPPFIPVALFGAEKPYATLTASKMGAYWNLMSNYLLRSGVFATQPEKARWIARYVQEHGGLCMGMLRFDQHSGLFANVRGVDDLYTLGYVLYLLETDQAERALVTFYGKLAQGFTRDTFIGAEGTGLEPLDKHGRPMYLPPNSASNALFLWTLRNLLVQDWDADDDGKPDTLRLLFATPRTWLRDGNTIRLEGAPTAFGPVGLRVTSRLKQGEVLAEVTMPPRRAQKALLRIRVPDGWRVVAARMENVALPVDPTGAVDLTGQLGRVGPSRIRFETRVSRE
ncbi:MAG: hypothetical protein KJZ87_04785 [Thermoguttaceae bacterium]|nr:hypothetical protein [Thermoguttaceae bacterium]